jgi:hypothetical protein
MNELSDPRVQKKIHTHKYLDNRKIIASEAKSITLTHDRLETVFFSKKAKQVTTRPGYYNIRM